MATINFKGKTAVWNHHLSVPYHTLEKDKGNSLEGKNDSENLIIEGDNLLALKALLPKYQGKVKCIYIDPPYNTGNEGWKYSDSVNSPIIKNWIGVTVGKEGEDLVRHDKWLCMMTPRLKLLKELLSDDGVIFVSIGDHEVGNLKVLLDDIFGQDKHVGTFVWKSRAKPTNAGNAKFKAQKVAEYVFAYSNKISADAVLFNVDSVKERTYPNSDENGNFRVTTILTSNRGTFRRETMRFEINGFAPNEEQRWKAGYDEINSLFAAGRLDFNDGVPFRKHYEQDEDEMLYPLYTFMDEALTGTAENGKSELNMLLGNAHGFDTVKPVGLLKYFISISTNPGDIILDSFAGSGTTAQAVLEINSDNKELEGRKFILVEMEKYVESITTSRVQKAISTYKYQAGFTYYKLGPDIEGKKILAGTNIPAWDVMAKYVHFLATGKPVDEVTVAKKTWEITATKKGTGVYLIYTDTLDELKKLAITRDWLETVKDKVGRKIVYAPACFLDKEILDEYNISFVQIPFNLFTRK